METQNIKKSKKKIKLVQTKDNPIEKTTIKDTPMKETPIEKTTIKENPSEENLIDKLKEKKLAELNKLTNDNELLERNKWSESEDNYRYLYPSLNDPFFNQKIAEKKEFNDTKYDGKIYKLNEEAEKLCNAEFELSPHQQFVRNFLSFQTPYNSLLLYHGLGSGKTCSAIGVAEEMRDYLNQLGINQRIIVVASPNVQENFKIQLFDETKLQLVDEQWTIKSCTGNKLLKEINPMNMRGLSKEKIITQIKNLINSSYLFMGYTEFAHYIEKKSDIGSKFIKNKDTLIKNRLKQTFNNRLIIIDEVHNIRISDENKGKRVALELFKLVQNVDNLRLLLLSATPLYNNYKEIVWLINLMNLNDKRSTIEVKDVFDSDGNFKINDEGQEIGKELLQRKATGYISFVRGNNPYTFPYRIWPSEFAPTKTLQNRSYPLSQLNGKSIIQGLNNLSLYISNLGSYQELGYNYIVNNLTPENKLSLENPDALGYIQLQRPLEALNMVYPNFRFSNIEESTIDTKELVGKNGLNNIMTFTEPPSTLTKTNFEYKDNILESYGRIFSSNEIGKYSGKIKEICNNILHSDGIILIYSLYLDGGLVPIALALEEMGITRYGNVKSLFKTPPVQNLDLKTYVNTNSKTAIPAKYVMITGDIKLSPNNVDDLKAATQKANVNGEKVKVILISQAGSEGLDFKFIRQVHILEPWYNLSRIEQIIGRAVRHCSHKDLPFNKRNVEIFLYGSILENETEEAADLYVYRLAEIKASQIGKVNRILKEIAVDCLLNSEQLNFTASKLQQTVRLILSNRQMIEYSVGDKPYSAQCDYMESCIYKCKPKNDIGEINTFSYSEAFIEMNSEKIIQRIKQIMKENFYYNKNDLIKLINIVKPYPTVQIYAALTQLVTDKNEFITDKYGRLGTLVNIGDYYFFQPLELTDENISLYEREIPIPFKHESIPFNISQKVEMDIKKQIEKTEAVNALQTLEKTDPEELSEIQKLEKDPDKTISTKHPGEEILLIMLNNYKTATSKQLIIRGDNDWYKYCSIVIKNLEMQGISKGILEELLISHLIEELLFEDVLNLLNFIYNKKELMAFPQKIKNYFEYHSLKNNNVTGLILQKWDRSSKKAVQQLVVLERTNWKLAEVEDYNDLKSNIEEIIKEPLANLIGFITNFNNNFMIFKVRQTDKPGHAGARCDQGGKLTSAQLNSIVGEEQYNAANIKKVPAQQLCVLEEFLLRLNDYNRKDEKRWFFTPGESSIINIKKR